MTTLISTIADWIAILGSIRFVYTYVKKAIKKRKDENERELRLFKEEVANMLGLNVVEKDFVDE